MENPTIQLGNNSWATKKDNLLAYNKDEQSRFKAIELDFTRNSLKNVTNRSGYLSEVAVGNPAIDFLDNPSGALLLEPQSTNLITYSEDFSQGYWNLAGGSKISGELSPNGDNSAFKIQFNGTGTGFFLRAGSVTLDANTTYTASWYIKNIDLDNSAIFRIEPISGGGIGSVNVNVNNDYNTISTSEFTRYSITFTTGDAIGVYRVRVMGAGSSNTSNSFVIANAQLEQQSYATSYMPTNGTIETRTADSASKTGLSNLIGQTEGVFYVEVSNYKLNSSILGINNSFVNMMQLGYTTSNLVRLVTYQSSAYAELNSVSSFNQGENLKIAISYASSGLKMFINGSFESVNPTAINFSGLLKDLYISQQYFFDNNGLNIKDLRVYDTALTDTELIDLTS